MNDPSNAARQEKKCGTSMLIGSAQNVAVRNGSVAKRIIFAVIRDIYGDVSHEYPILITDVGDGYVFKGTLPPHHVGGVVEGKICKSDASFSYLTHGK
jgi:hypothetical protein